MTIVYLHGFNSGPTSLKAAETARFLAEHAPDMGFHCPQLSPHPAQAIRQAEALIRSLDGNIILIGSSLGGFYATWLAERHQCKAVLINPAVLPHVDLSGFAGPQTNPYTGEHYVLEQQDLLDLQSLQVDKPVKGDYWLWLGTADEVLDWRQAVIHYQGHRQTVFNGDDHRLQRWNEALAPVLKWAER